MTKNNRKYREPPLEEVIECIDDGKFQIGQSYDDEADKTMRCKRCGTDKFYVGRGSYHTAIKCPECEYELCIHDG